MPAEVLPTPQASPEPGENPQFGEHIRELGQSIAVWAKNHNFNPRLVYAVMRGERKCIRGQSYEIAKELGMRYPTTLTFLPQHSREGFVHR